MLDFKLTTDINGIESLARGKMAALEAALVNKVDVLDALLQQRIVDTKLQGQVLKMITGKLAGSVEAIPATVSDSVIEGTVQAAGGVAFYGRFQEDGTSGPYEILPKNGNVLAFLSGGKQIFARKVIHPGLPARSFVGSSFEEMRDQIINELQAVPFEVAAQ